MFGAIIRGTLVLVAGAVGTVSENLTDKNEQFADEVEGKQRG